MTRHDTITRDALAGLVRLFYARVRADEQLGPVFERAVHDWDEHLDKLTEFWSAVTLGTRNFKGSPVQAHQAQSAYIKPGMFDRWLALWERTTGECFAPEPAADLQAKARRIGRSLQLALSQPRDEAPPFAQEIQLRRPVIRPTAHPQTQTCPTRP